jgi:hypothetical protein
MLVERNDFFKKNFIPVEHPAFRGSRSRVIFAIRTKECNPLAKIALNCQITQTYKNKEGQLTSSPKKQLQRHT